jgi:hypothetical protein
MLALLDLPREILSHVISLHYQGLNLKVYRADNGELTVGNSLTYLSFTCQYLRALALTARRQFLITHLDASGVNLDLALELDGLSRLQLDGLHNLIRSMSLWSNYEYPLTNPKQDSWHTLFQRYSSLDSLYIVYKTKYPPRYPEPGENYVENLQNALRTFELDHGKLASLHKVAGLQNVTNRPNWRPSHTVGNFRNFQIPYLEGVFVPVADTPRPQFTMYIRLKIDMPPPPESINLGHVVYRADWQYSHSYGSFEGTRRELSGAGSKITWIFKDGEADAVLRSQADEG